MLSLILAMTLTQPDADAIRARIAIELALQQQSKPVVEVQTPAVQVVTYEQAHVEAYQRGLPFVVGVGCDAPAGEWVTVNVPSLVGYRAGQIVVGLPYRDGRMQLVGVLPAPASAGDVLRLMAPRRTAPAPQRWGPYNESRDPKTGKRVSLSNGRAANC